MSDLHKFRFRPFDSSGTIRWSSYRAHFEMRLATKDIRDPAEKKCAFFQVTTEMFDYVASASIRVKKRRMTSLMTK